MIAEAPVEIRALAHTVNGEIRWRFFREEENMNIHNIQIERIKPYGRNPRKNDQAVDAVAASIQEFGFRVPLLIDKNNVIVAGHTRYKAAKKLGMNELPCIIADDLTPTQVKAYRMMDIARFFRSSKA